MPRLLIVDDDQYCRESLSDALAGTDHHIRFAKDGGEAIAMIAEEKPDLILLDLEMPDVDGFQVLCYLTTTPDCADIRTIIITAERELVAGANNPDNAVNYIPKPYSHQELRDLVTAVLTSCRPDNSPSTSEAPPLVPHPSSSTLSGKPENAHSVVTSRGVASAGGVRTRPPETGSSERPGKAACQVAFDALPHGVVLTSQDGTINYVNAAVEESFGYSKNDLVGQSIRILIHDSAHTDYDGFRHKNSLTAQTVSSSNRLSIRVRRKDGTSFTVELALATATFDGKSFVLASMIDTSHRELAEARFRHVFEASASGMILIDSRGRIQLANQAIETMFGYKRVELINQPIETLVPRRFRHGHVAQRNAFIANPETRSMGAGRDLFGLKKDGTEFPVELGLNPIKTEEGTLVLGSVIDITERQRAADRLREMTEEALQANQSKSEFLAAMSHELRTPLNAILGFSQGLLERADRQPLNEHQKDRIAKIYKSGEHLLSLINNILDIAKVEAGKTDLHITTFPLTLVFNDVLALAQAVAREKPGLTVTLDVEPHLPEITTDAGKLKQILINLASNACKFTARGTVTLKAECGSGGFILSVADTGVGITPDQLDRVFEKFHQIRQATSQSIKGTGLGLPLSKKLAELLGGSISVQSKAGEGTVFSVRLPLILSPVELSGHGSAVHPASSTDIKESSSLTGAPI
jgi:PAS domain S-box-containing protein